MRMGSLESPLPPRERTASGSSEDEVLASTSEIFSAVTSLRPRRREAPVLLSREAVREDSTPDAGEFGRSSSRGGTRDSQKSARRPSVERRSSERARWRTGMSQSFSLGTPRASKQHIQETKGQLTVQEKYEQEALEKLQQDAEDLEWLRVLDSRLLQLQWYVTFLALVGFLLAALVSEITISSSDTTIEVLKALTTCCTLVQVFLMGKQLKLRADYAHTQLLLQERGRGTQAADVPHNAGLTAKNFRQEGALGLALILYNLIHPVPGVSGTVTIEQLGMQPTYKVEALIAGAMVLRIYHILYLFKLKMITKFLSLDSSLIVRNVRFPY